MRLFVAAEIPVAVRQSLRKWIVPLEVAFPRARWVRTDHLHVTLKFIGDAHEKSLEPIRAALREIPPEPPIELSFRGAGFFPNDRRPRVLWAGVEAGAELASLAETIDSALAAVGIPSETRDFRPHLTLARFPENSDFAALTRLREALAAAGTSPDFGAARIANFHLYRSVLNSSGAEYTRLDSFALARSDSE